MTTILSHPRYKVPLEVLRDAGKPMTTREWFTSDPRLAGIPIYERRGIAIRLYQSGYIEHGPRTTVYITPDGKPCDGVYLKTWRLR